MPTTDESEEIQEARKALMEMELDELKTVVLGEIKKLQPDVELPSGGKEEIVAWAMEWWKAREAKEAEEAEERAKAREAREEKKRAEEREREEARLSIVEPHKEAPEQLYSFLQANPSALPAFVKSIVTDPTHAAWLGEAVGHRVLQRRLGVSVRAEPSRCDPETSKTITW